jgi:hypothetical protein
LRPSYLLLIVFSVLCSHRQGHSHTVEINCPPRLKLEQSLLDDPATIHLDSCTERQSQKPLQMKAAFSTKQICIDSTL